MNILIDKNNTRFLLTNNVMSYGFTLMETGLPVNLYWGCVLPRALRFRRKILR